MTATTTQRYTIFATDGFGKGFFCFHWTGTAEAGIARAKSDAEYFGRKDLRDFRAIEIE